jgi:hypothetical protein
MIKRLLNVILAGVCFVCTPIACCFAVAKYVFTGISALDTLEVFFDYMEREI